MSALTVVETEVSSKAKRRRFTAEYKRKVLQEADGCDKPGEVAALLRREGLGRVPIRVEKRKSAFFRLDNHQRAVLPDGHRRNAPWGTYQEAGAVA